LEKYNTIQLHPGYTTPSPVYKTIWTLILEQMFVKIDNKAAQVKEHKSLNKIFTKTKKN